MVAALASTVCPNAAPASVAVSKLEKGWNGQRFTALRSTAAFRKDRSNHELWPTRIARLQPALCMPARTSLKMRCSASRSSIAGRNGCHVDLVHLQ
jgi:hypothetical protein